MLLCKINKIWSIKNNLKFHKASKVYFSNYNNTSHLTKEHIKASSYEYNFRGQLKSLLSQNEVQKYVSFRSEIIRDLTEPNEDLPEFIEQYKKVLEYNLPESMKYTGIILLSAYKMFESPENLTPENLRLATILSWCVDLIHSSTEMCDDMLDGTVIRNSLPSWYKVENVGNQAINDALLILHAPYILLKKHFFGHHCYFPCIEWMHKMNINVFMGQSQDIILSETPNLATFTRQKYRCLVDYKGTYPQYLLAVTLAMYLAKIYNMDRNKPYSNVMFELGEYFTAQNDILDCYGYKMGNDIQEGKCSWLIVMALEHANDTQRELLNKHYGVREIGSELKVKNVYKELGILDLFLKYEQESYQRIYKLIEKLPKALSGEFFRKLVDVSYGQQHL